MNALVDAQPHWWATWVTDVVAGQQSERLMQPELRAPLREGHAEVRFAEAAQSALTRSDFTAELGQRPGVRGSSRSRSQTAASRGSWGVGKYVGR